MPLAAHSRQRPKILKAPLLYTWLLGLVVFIDDYLNALAVGSSMRKVTDKFKVSREMLAYVVDSTAAPYLRAGASVYLGRVLRRLIYGRWLCRIRTGHGPLYQCYSLYGLPHSSHAFSTFSGSGDCARTGDDEVCRAESSRGYCATSPLMRAKKRVWSIQRIGFKSTTLCYPLWPCWVLVSGMTWMYRSA